MLPRACRLASGQSIQRVVRRGKRVPVGSLVVHVSVGTDLQPARAALVVSRKVGGSVVRHRVQRRLRHLLRPRLGLLGPGIEIVVRAQPSAAAATSVELGRDLDRALAKAGF